MKPIQDTLNERQATHGNYVDQSVLTCTILETFRSGANWKQLTSAQEFALMMIASKIGRILTGDQNHADSWHDIAGYATLVERAIGTRAYAPPAPPPPSPSSIKTEQEYKDQLQREADAVRREHQELARPRKWGVNREDMDQ